MDKLAEIEDKIWLTDAATLYAALVNPHVSYDLRFVDRLILNIERDNLYEQIQIKLRSIKMANEARELLVSVTNEELYIILEAAYQSLHGDAMRDTLDISDELADDIMGKLNAVLDIEEDEPAEEDEEE